MLVITRKKGESILIGENIEIKIIGIENNQVKIGIEAPKEKTIYRNEVYEKIKEENKKALNKNIDILKMF
ncbi:MAG: carbon storage regulator CsrA [Paraclostridium sp.]